MMLNNILFRANSNCFRSPLFRGNRDVLYFYQSINKKTTHIKQKTSKDLKEEHIKKWVANLTPKERQLLVNTLQCENGSSNPESDVSTSTVVPATTKQLLYVGLYYSLPYVGFGFLDNFIMIVAGDYIELTIGVGMGISTMAAAGLGNAISDVAGVGSAFYVESLVRKLGLPSPELNPTQFASRSVTWAINIGRAIGVALGCILGMIPLIWLPKKESNDSAEVEESTK